MGGLRGPGSGPRKTKTEFVDSEPVKGHYWFVSDKEAHDNEFMFTINFY